MTRPHDDEESSRWRAADDDPDEPREWEEVEPEEEKDSRGGVLGGTAPWARVVFAVILLAIVVTTIIALKDGLARWFGG